jgi:fumarate hydratase class I
MVDKAERGPAAIEAIVRHRAPYRIAVDGTAYLISKSIKAARVVAFEELDIDAIHEFEIENMPVTLAGDVEGRSVHKAGPAEWRGRMTRLARHEWSCLRLQGCWKCVSVSP